VVGERLYQNDILIFRSSFPEKLFLEIISFCKISIKIFTEIWQKNLVKLAQIEVNCTKEIELPKNGKILRGVH